MSKRTKSLAIDFDGVIHAYTKGWQGGEIYDDPVPGALESMEKLSAFYDVFIFTTRGDTLEKVLIVKAWLQKWQEKLGLPPRDYIITNLKRPAIAYLDDRAIRFMNLDDFRKMYD